MKVAGMRCLLFWLDYSDSPDSGYSFFCAPLPVCGQGFYHIIWWFPTRIQHAYNRFMNWYIYVDAHIIYMANIYFWSAEYCPKHRKLREIFLPPVTGTSACKSHLIGRWVIKQLVEFLPMQIHFEILSRMCSSIGILNMYNCIRNCMSSKSCCTSQ